MTAVHILATDFATRSFQIGKTAAGGTVLFNRMVSRAKLETALREHAPCIVAIEACATSHFRRRLALPPTYAIPGYFARPRNPRGRFGGFLARS